MEENSSKSICAESLHPVLLASKSDMPFLRAECGVEIIAVIVSPSVVIMQRNNWPGTRILVSLLPLTDMSTLSVLLVPASWISCECHDVWERIHHASSNVCVCVWERERERLCRFQHSFSHTTTVSACCMSHDRARVLHVSAANSDAPCRRQKYTTQSH